MQTQFEYSAFYNEDTKRVTIKATSLDTQDYDTVTLPASLAEALGDQAFAAYIVEECDFLHDGLIGYVRAEIEREARRAEDMGNAAEIAQLIEETFAGRWNADLPVSVRVGIGSSSVVKGFKI